MTDLSLRKTHVSLNVSDLQESVKFYEAFFGETTNKLKEKYANFDLSNPPLKLALNEVKGDRLNGNLSHLGIQIQNYQDAEKSMQRLRDNGLVKYEEKGTNCCYAIQDKLWVSDPDGNKWEVYVVLDELKDSLDNKQDACFSEEKKEKSCCT